MTLDATYRTDFAQVEVDQQQVNLTRFNLFFPEKRDFFLENSGTFAFGARQPQLQQLREPGAVLQPAHRLERRRDADSDRRRRARIRQRRRSSRARSPNRWAMSTYGSTTLAPPTLPIPPSTTQVVISEGFTAAAALASR